ncbi:ABC transporter permease subunit [Psychromonas sp. Urea-02u-13]|uniref:ABC transporter permease subunit n=1 Tax=Psychromonas sp. Urea-02u-13 TaxID=2058326 RepID=UPI000C34D205|nr:ABC transporter permease subunit [Psychromonas sp. Urea-02u-13]PKG37684.1 phosphate ABC transporter permease [Psychromonas sp. Urea-02u-13]
MHSDLSNRLRANQKRVIKDKIVKYCISSGGALVLVTLLLIFGYLLYVVLPIFAPVTIEAEKQFMQTKNEQLYALGLDEQNDISYQVNEQGVLSFYSLREQDLGALLLTKEMLKQPVAFAQSSPSTNIYLLSNQTGQVTIFKPDFATSYPNDKRLITAKIDYPLGESLIEVDPQGAPITVASFELSEEGGAIAAVTNDNRGLFVVLTATEDMMSEEIFWEQELVELPSLPHNVSQMLLSPDLNNLFVRSGDDLLVYDISNTNNIRIKSALPINALNTHVSDIQLLTGASSLMVANENGVISQWFEVLKDNKRTFTFIRDFTADANVANIVPEYFRKGFLTTDKKGYLSIFHTTGNTRLLNEKISDNDNLSVAFSPRANAILVIDEQKVTLFKLDNEHPEITWSALWQQVWYEGYPEAAYIWQSTSASDDFEAKMSLVPISFGTIKAAFYAMLFAVPIAISGAIYTAYFMSPAIRTYVKPTVEIMEALPTVILGFLAGLWLAPLIENQLPGIILLLLALPLSVLATALLWTLLPKNFKQKIPEGIHPLILIPVLLCAGYISMSLSGPLEMWLFDGDTRMYLTNELGIDFDQRNSLIVGIAMGFAVIPTIYSIAEDAIFSVPKSLTMGSLALGATPWQTLAKVVILTASPGIFSAVMMGTGRAVGETMIVLMATGNTPIMDWNIFEGMRSLSANIAVEMPESEVGSSHYRVLFLAAFVLFIFTFIFNTVAELVRQRLREKYSSL